MSRPLAKLTILPIVVPMTGMTAWEVCRRLCDLPQLLFLDSAQTSSLGRYSYVTADPTAYFTSHGGWIAEDGQVTMRADPLTVLARRLADFAVEPMPNLPPFQGGAAGLFAYELGHHFENLPRTEFNDFGVPDLAIGIYDWVIAFDHHANTSWLISTGYPESPADARLARARARAEEVQRRLARPAPPLPDYAMLPAPLQAPSYPVAHLAGVRSNFDEADYLRTVARAIEYTHAGDCFQVNIAQRLLAPAPRRLLDLYGRLRERNPAPFAGYFDMGDHQILSASPERFMQVAERNVVTRPIKGTRPRDQTPEEDRRLADELRASAKDRSENVMIVDLLRNDLGRVCEYGSVRVEAVCKLESYQFVHHLVSDVRGRLRDGFGPTDLLRAAFPGGSVTGAPKIRAMEIITELERTARGPYCGSLGYIGFDGTMDTNLLIRTIVASKGHLHFSVGGGVVADSIPEREYAETWQKAEGLLRALPE